MKPEAFEPIQFGFSTIDYSKLPTNKMGISIIGYLKVLWNVIWSELTTFFSLYLITLSLLEFIPEMSVTTPWITLLPILLIISLEYVFQAIDLKRSQKSFSGSDSTHFNVTRGGETKRRKSKAIVPGDIIDIHDTTPVPCDCILLRSTERNVLVNTSKIDGETEAKNKAALPLNRYSEGYLQKARGQVQIDQLQNGIHGTFLLLKTEEELEAQEIVQDLNESLEFDTDNFIERGTIIESEGNFLLLAILTGKNCKSASSSTFLSVRKTLIDQYIEKISMFLFCVQVVISCVIGGYGYYSYIKHRPKYIPSIALDNPRGEYKLIVLIARNFVLCSMIPVSIKILLPVARFIYGLFISYDKNFIDDTTKLKADALSTNVTENLGGIDVIVSDKTGTLTKNELKLVSMIIGDKKFGDNRQAATLYEDNIQQALKETLDEKLTLMFQALSICHSYHIKESQELDGSSADELAILNCLIQLGWEFHPHKHQNAMTFKAPFGDYTFEVLHTNKFDRNRMRMSVVVKHGEKIYCFMKGASEKVISQCKSGDIQKMESDYKSYQSKGFRTLSVSYKEIPDFVIGTQAEQLESDHEYLGTIAIEDTLQTDTQISIDILSQAGIKFWIATGDACRNTLVTAALLHLVESQNVVNLTNDNLLSEIRNPNDNYLFSKKALDVEEGSFSTLIDAENDKLIREVLQSNNFVNALLRSRCVIFYRCKPLTKADISIALQNNGKRVLAIGDGYNDSALLSCSNVGIGIIGKNGGRSFTGCDFAVPGFRCILRLLLIHGHQSLHRSVLIVNFSFYKVVLIAICQAIYQIWTDGTAQSFFDQFSLVTYNYVWTLIPLISIIFDKDISDGFLFKLSYLYKKLRNPLTIVPSNVQWFYIALYQGVVTIFTTYLLIGESFMNPYGADFGKSFISIMVFFALVFTCTFYIISKNSTFTFYSIILQVGNLLLLIATSSIVESGITLTQYTKEWIGFFGEVFNNINTLLILLTIVLLNITPPWLVTTIYSEFKLSETVRVIETETIASKNDEPLFFDPPKKY
ncbi:Phospholipid-transporting ATPase 2 [Histomonas meleagridis]|uniref:Phospholipid-transporting ATPase 2 n=1 Tax=Histomonas meleagridis TaxID=135588 RepID=UPI003559CDF8|nr:Phospholipid-transporting ATPase 2 [Histomonas meleagridis]KAH0804515.1 Phospholipid-transporting ATPase 2 [Histomonas meleagridis]